MLVHHVLNDELKSNVLQIRVGRSISGVIADRQIEPIPTGHNVGVAVDEAGEGAASHGASRSLATIVDVERGTVVVEIVGAMIHEAGDAPRPVAPAQTRPVNQARSRFDTLLCNPVIRSEVGVETIYRSGGRIQGKVPVQIIGAGNAGVERADITEVPIVADVEVKAVQLQPASVHGR